MPHGKKYSSALFEHESMSTFSPNAFGSEYNRCGPCVLMAPEFESAAQDLKGKVRFVKLDTDKDETMAARLNIMGLPTLLFLDKFEGTDEGSEDEQEAKAVLKGRIEGALRKDNIVDLCEHYFFDGPEPKIM
jgi:thiol-disulfide isomerase/thioredoxin